MNIDDAIAAVRFLSRMTSGWTDETAAAYAVELSALHEPDALDAAVRTIAATWTDPWRPTLGVIIAAYRHELAARPALPEHVDDDDWVSADRGAVVAWEAYVDEVDRLGRVADPGRFGRLLGQSSQSMPSSSATSRR